MTHPFFSELNETLICEHKTNSWNTDDTTPYHCHDGYEILVFIGGHASFFVENDGKILELGDIVCCPPGAFHRAMPLQDKAYDRFLIAIPHEQLEKLNTVNTNLASCFFRGRASLPLLHPSQNTFQKILSCCRELEQCLAEHIYGWDVLCTALLSQILVMLNQEKAVLSAPSFSNPIPPLVSEIYDYIDKNFTDTLSVSQLAVHFHHNADYLTRVFQRFSGYTIKQFILLKRISYAKELLQKGHLPNDVCFLCGFQNYSNFSRCFHNHLGLSPRKYQQSLSERTL